VKARLTLLAVVVGAASFALMLGDGPWPPI
jgi:hypothetical protein